MKTDERINTRKGFLRFLIGLSAVWISCFTAVFSADSDSLDAGDRPFIETEPVDLTLLQGQLNLALGEALSALTLECGYDPRVARAADTMLLHPEYDDSTDDNGRLIPFDRMLVEREGRQCRFVRKIRVNLKTVSPTIRRFDDSDTYAAVAARTVVQMLVDNADFILTSGCTGFGVGVRLVEEYPETADGGGPADEPKEEWVQTLFFIVP
jgi:hypothetical protein